MSQGFHVPAMSSSQLEVAGSAMRRALGIDDEEKCPNLEAAIQYASAQPGAFFGLKLEAISDREMDAIDAEADAYVEFAPLIKLVVRQRVLQGSRNRVGRDRFTIAHEISHLWLNHHGVRKFRSTAPRREGEYEPPPHKNSESQADKCASFALVPTALAMKYKTVDELSRDFGVSRKAAEVRLADFAKLSARDIPTNVVNLADRLRIPTSRSKNQLSPAQKNAAILDRLWEKAAHASDRDPRHWRLCAKGHLIAKSEHTNHRSPFGWCWKDGLVLSYTYLNGMGLGEWHAKIFDDCPCRECGNFTLVRNGTCLKCDTCGGTSGCS